MKGRTGEEVAKQKMGEGRRPRNNVKQTNLLEWLKKGEAKIEPLNKDTNTVSFVLEREEMWPATVCTGEEKTSWSMEGREDTWQTVLPVSDEGRVRAEQSVLPADKLEGGSRGSLSCQRWG